MSARRARLARHRRAALAGVLGMAACAPGPLGAAAPDCRLAPCPDSPNCVASLDANPQRRIPAYAPGGDPGQAWQALRERLQALPRTQVLVDEPAHLQASVRSALLGFVDDVELRYCAADGVIVLRSASRSGYWDMGVNRRRIERLLAPLLAEGLLRARP